MILVTTELQELRSQALERDGGCVWPGCDQNTKADYHESGRNYFDRLDDLQLAHLTHRGMGGSSQRNTLDNVVILCRRHHDCLDGRTGLGTLRIELNQMLKHAARID